jgi:hypothetical protein
VANSDGSSRPLAISVISREMLNVSTSLVVRVTSRITSPSRPRRTHRSLGHNEFPTGTLATYLECRRPIAGEPKEAAHD